MTDSNNKHSHGFFSNALGVAKKISATGVDVLSHVAPERVAKIIQPQKEGQILEENTHKKTTFDVPKYDDPQHMLRQYLPNLSKQLLGRQYNTVNRVANFVSPQFSDKLSDYFFEHLNQFTSNLSSVDTVLDQAGAQNLEELTQDVSRSKRISQALAEQNKWLASMQGAVTGATGVVGAAIDVPLTLVMSLRMIYQVGRAHGFALNKEIEQEIVQFIFKQIDLGLLAEKQSVLMALKALSSMLQTHDISQVQKLLGSSNEIDVLKKWLVSENGEMKWDWLNQIPKISLLGKLTPVAGAGIGAAYSWKLLEDVHQKAQQIFSQARIYLQQNQGVDLSPIAAYEKSLELLNQAAPKLLDHFVKNEVAEHELKLDQDIKIADHQTISSVTIKKKTAAIKVDETEKGQQVQHGLENLAEQMVVPHEQVAPQKTAITADEPEWDEYLQEDDGVNEINSAQPSVIQTQQNDLSKPIKKKVTKKNA